MMKNYSPLLLQRNFSKLTCSLISDKISFEFIDRASKHGRSAWFFVRVLPFGLFSTLIRMLNYKSIISKDILKFEIIRK